MKYIKTFIIFILIFAIFSSANIVEAKKKINVKYIEDKNENSADKIDVTTLGINNDGSDVTNKLNSLPSGNYYFPKGIYGVNGFDGISYQGFKPKSNSTYTFADGAIIKILTNRYTHYAGIFIKNCDNVTLINPRVEGDRETHDFSADSTHEWGHGILIAEGNGTITIENPYIYDVTGDGIDLISPGSNVTINNFKIERARRQGISIESAGTVLLNDGLIRDISGTSPASGIDIEPYEMGQRLDEIIINNVVTDNTHQGLLLANLHMVNDYQVTINDCTFDGIFVNNIAKTASGIVTINNPIINGSNMGVVWTNAYANVKMINPIFNLSSLNNEGVREGIFRFYELDRENGDIIGGFYCIGAEILNYQSENEYTRIFNFSTSSKTKVSDISITVTKSNLTNTLWATTPSAIDSIFLSEPNNKNIIAGIK